MSLITTVTPSLRVELVWELGFAEGPSDLCRVGVGQKLRTSALPDQCRAYECDGLRARKGKP
jgi:hypothetical protein